MLDTGLDNTTEMFWINAALESSRRIRPEEGLIRRQPLTVQGTPPLRSCTQVPAYEVQREVGVEDVAERRLHRKAPRSAGAVVRDDGAEALEQCSELRWGMTP